MLSHACLVGGELLGEDMHPPSVLSAVPMALSMPGWRASDYAQVEPHLIDGVRFLARAGADFFICPDNTAHIVLERCVGELPLPGLHIAEVTSQEAVRRGFRRVGLLGTRWTMSGDVTLGQLPFPQRSDERGIRARGVGLSSGVLGLAGA